MKLSELTDRIREYEGDIAPGSETLLLGEYNEAMRKATGALPTQLGRLDTPDPEVPEDEAQWWLRAYHYLDGHRDADRDEIITAAL